MLSRHSSTGSVNRANIIANSVTQKWEAGGVVQGRETSPVVLETENLCLQIITHVGHVCSVDKCPHIFTECIR